MRYWHGEMILENTLTQFRYSRPDTDKPDDVISYIVGMFPCAVVKWIRPGFLPADTEAWGEWSMREPDEYTQTAVEQQ